jgi:excisionase family DNA binding protein
MSQVDTQDRLALRIPDVARLLGCSELAARRLVDRKEIPFRRLGRRIILFRDEVEAFLRNLPASK